MKGKIVSGSSSFSGGTKGNLIRAINITCSCLPRATYIHTPVVWINLSIGTTERCKFFRRDRAWLGAQGDDAEAAFRVLLTLRCMYMYMIEECQYADTPPTRYSTTTPGYITLAFLSACCAVTVADGFDDGPAERPTHPFPVDIP